jgi:hypothetical protein
MKSAKEALDKTHYCHPVHQQAYINGWKDCADNIKPLLEELTTLMDGIPVYDEYPEIAAAVNVVEEFLKQDASRKPKK